MFVLDTSVAMAWCFEDESSPASEAMLDRLRAEGALVPALWSVEVANALLIGQRRQRLNAVGLAAFLRLVETLPVSVDNSAPMDVLRRVRGLAQEQSLTVYDASFLELAIRRGLPLASRDRRLATAAERAGVDLLPG